MMPKSHFHFHSDLLWLCELPCSLILPTRHAWKPGRMLSNHSLNTQGHQKRKYLLLVAASCPRSAGDTQESQNHRILSSRRGSRNQSPEELGIITFLPSLPLSSLLSRVCGSGRGRLWLCALLAPYLWVTEPGVVGTWSLWKISEVTLQSLGQVEVLRQG